MSRFGQKIHKALVRRARILPAPESAHSIKAVFDEALECKRTGVEKTILTLLSGHGFFDMKAYENYLSGTMELNP